MSCNPYFSKINGPVVREFLFEHSNTIAFSIQGNSMYPLVKQGQTLAVSMLDDTTALKRGGLYVFTMHGILAVHRFARMRKGKAVFSGDNCATTEQIARRDVVGSCDLRQQPMLCRCVNMVNMLLDLLPFSRRVLFYIKKVLVTLMEGIYEKKL
jgi:hypothetical protein